MGISSMNSRKKNLFFIVIFRGSLTSTLTSAGNALSHPELGVCWGNPVTWAKKQTKSRNVENSVTAHKYKLCDKGGYQVSYINSFLKPVLKKSAVRIDLTWLNLPDQPPEDPPPLEKLTGGPLPHPLLPIINCAPFSKPFFASGCCPSGSFSPCPLSSLVGKGGSGGISAPSSPGGTR